MVEICGYVVILSPIAPQRRYIYYPPSGPSSALASPPLSRFPPIPAITLLLLPFIGVGLFLLRRNFQRGGVSRKVVAGLARKMAERGHYPAGGVGGGGGGGVGPIDQWMQRAPSQGMWSSVLARMLGGGLRAMELVGVLRR